MEQFNLDTWLQDKNRKVVTRHGNPVRIVCWDRKHDFPIIALEECGNKEFVNFVTSDGKIDLSGLEDNHDLFFADKELTEFEARIYNLINFYDPDNYPSIEEVKEEAEILLDLARKELEKEYRIVDKDDNNWEDGYKHGYKQGKQDIEKDLLKLEKSKACIDPTLPVMYTYAESKKTYVEYDGYKLCINDAFEKLSKEE